MAKEYNFDEVLQQDKPSIIFGGHRYQLRYPTLEELESLQDLKDQDKQVKAMFGFVEPLEGSPNFEKLVRSKDIRALKAFSDMIKQEFGVEEE